jgi:proteic killer suppression protein
MIQSFRHKGLKLFFETGSTAGIRAEHAAKLGAMLLRLNVATDAQAMNLPGWKLHPLKGSLSGHWSVWVSGNWRLTFTFVGVNAELVDCQDYH